MKPPAILICEPCGVAIPLASLRRGEVQVCSQCNRPLTPHKLKQPKYRNQRVQLDGHWFDSKKEAARYGQLLILLKSGHITKLEIHPKYVCIVNGVKVCAYVADFRYVDRQGKTVVEDVKSPGTKTRRYAIKRKLVKALFGVVIQEV